MSEFIDAILDKYGAHSEPELHRLTNVPDGPWARNESWNTIPDTDMAAFFESLPAEEQVFNPEIVVIPPEPLTEIDEDEDAQKLTSALAGTHAVHK